MDSALWWLFATLLGVPLVITSLPEFGLLAIGAASAMVAAGLGAGATWQILTFVGVSIVMLVGVRPLAYRMLRKSPQVRMGIEALQGATAVVQERVDHDGGRIKLNGEIWSARALFPNQVYEPGQQVDVVEIKGATALVI
ncbi:NfeD family protein [Kitasatospora sp. GAS204B]|uniref:NfeD family protein n=1 Tax=unclassified Kitasatospora TaxID=2633591 RepID=UPI0024772599|nr:NfeD family protein [Kitasatospora sp. GAS204B]MDH6119730.1 membrane protein implicated in regulation of membrane protease activity [Kitasatospora sp. GAS204B]